MFFDRPERRRLLAWAVLAVGFLFVSTHRLSTAVLAGRLMRAFDTTGAALGTLHAAFFYVYAVLQLPAGALADRYGPRHVATAGIFLVSVGAVGFSLSGSYLAAFAARLVMGLGAGVVYLAILRFGTTWFRADEFATFNGVTAAVSGIGGIVSTVPLAVAAETFGWRTAVAALGVAGIAVAVAVYAVVRDTPAAAGFDPIEGVPEAPDLSLADVWANVGDVVRDPGIWMAGVVLFVGVGVNTTVLGLWGVPYIVQQYGVSVTEASTYTFVGNVGFLLGSPFVGWLSDRIGSRTSLMAGGAACYALVFGLFAAWGTPPLVAVGALFFLVSLVVGSFVLGYTVVKERHSHGASGVAVGATNALAFFGAAVFPTVMGAVLDAYWTGQTVNGARAYTGFGYRVAFGVAAAAGVVAFVCALWLVREGE